MKQYPAFSILRGLLAVACWVTAGCAGAPRLVPAPEAILAEGKPVGALGEATGVRVTVRPQAWRGEPVELTDALTPLRVEIRNQSARPIAIRYNLFGLQNDAGFRMSALAPLQIERNSTEIVRTDRVIPAPFRSRRRSLGDRSYYRYPVGGPGYYPQYVQWVVPLPTQDMLDKGVHEGTLEPGGHLEGFLYFPPLAAGTTQATFVLELTDAGTQERLGQIAVPFTVI